MFGSLMSGVLSDRLGRRPLLIISGLVMSLSLSMFGLYSLYHHLHKTSLDCIPLLCVLLSSCSYSAGIHPVSWLLLGEVFPLQYRAQGTSFTAAFSYFSAFLSVKTFVDFTNLLGLHGTCWVYGAVSLVGVSFYWSGVVPETREEPLQEMRGKSARSNRGGS